MPERNRVTCNGDEIRESRTSNSVSFAWKALEVVKSMAGGITVASNAIDRLARCGQ
jgi:hypothetical protein